MVHGQRRVLFLDEHLGLIKLSLAPHMIKCTIRYKRWMTHRRRAMRWRVRWRVLWRRLWGWWIWANLDTTSKCTIRYKWPLTNKGRPRHTFVKKRVEVFIGFALSRWLMGIGRRGWYCYCRTWWFWNYRTVKEWWVRARTLSRSTSRKFVPGCTRYCRWCANIR